MRRMAVVFRSSSRTLVLLARSLFRGFRKKKTINWLFKHLETIWRRRNNMALNPIIDLLGRRLRLAVIGGGPGSFIGAMHRQSARLDDRYEIVTGVVSSNPDKAKQSGLELGFAADRIYTNVTEML